MWGEGIFTIGEIISGDKVRKGSKFLFLTRQCNYPSVCIRGEESKIFNSTFQVFTLPTSQNVNGYWGRLGSGTGSSVLDLYVEGFRQLAWSNASNVYIGVRSTSMIETPGAVLKNITISGSSYCMRHSTVGGLYIHQCDLSGATLAPVNPYQSDKNLAGHVSYYIDCDWGTFADTNKCRWSISLTPKLTNLDHKIQEMYSLQMNIVDDAGLPISDVNVVLKDVDGTEVLNVLTNPDGYVGTEQGIATSATNLVLNDTAKSWSVDQHFYKEILLTSGAGAGQRRIIKKGGTATQIPFAWDCTVTPSAGTKYIIIPYIVAKSMSPIDMTPNTVRLSVAKSFGQFTLTVSKTGYETYTKIMNINEAVKETIQLKTALKMRRGLQGEVYLADNPSVGSSAKILKV